MLQDIIFFPVFGHTSQPVFTLGSLPVKAQLGGKEQTHLSKECGCALTCEFDGCTPDNLPAAAEERE